MNARQHALEAKHWVQASAETALASHRSERWRRRVQAEEMEIARTHALVALALAHTEVME